MKVQAGAHPLLLLLLLLKLPGTLRRLLLHVSTLRLGRQRDVSRRSRHGSRLLGGTGRCLSIYAAINGRGQLNGSKLHHRVRLLLHMRRGQHAARGGQRGGSVLRVCPRHLLGWAKGHEGQRGGDQGGRGVLLLPLLLQGCELRMAQQARVHCCRGHAQRGLLGAARRQQVLLLRRRRLATKVGNHRDGRPLLGRQVRVQVGGAHARHGHARRERSVLRRQQAACNRLHARRLRALLPRQPARRHAHRMLLGGRAEVVHE